MTDLFGLVAATRLPSACVQLDDTHFCFELPDAANLSRFCVWLTAPLPDGFQVAVYSAWSGSVPQLVGFVSNEQPSAILCIARTGFPGVDAPDTSCVIGLSVETLDAVAALIQSGALVDASVDDPVAVCAAILSRFVEFASSFAQKLGATDVLPLSVVAEFYQRFTRRLAIDPLWWRRAPTS